MEQMEELQQLLYQGEFLVIEEKLNQNKQWSEELFILNQCLKIFKLEVEQEEKITIFDYSLDIEKLKKHFCYVKLLLRRFEFGLAEELQKAAYQYFLDNEVSNSMLLFFMNHNLFYRRQFSLNMAKTASLIEGESSPRAILFGKIAEQLEEECYE